MYLKIENICKNFGEKAVLKNVNINVKKGEVVSIIGQSGVGKTTLFNIIAGFIKQDSGQVLLNNKPMEYDKNNFSYMQQKHLLLPHLNVFDNICLPMKIAKTPKEVMLKKANDALNNFEILEHKNKFLTELSGGQKQRIAFIRTYLKNQDLIFLDEPFSSLDTISKYNIYDWFIKFIQKNNSTILLITHDINEAIILSNKVYVLKKNFDTIYFDIDFKNNCKKLNNIIENEKFFYYYNEILNNCKK